MTTAAKTAPLRVPDGAQTLEDRVKRRLRAGATLLGVASAENISVALATIIVEDLTRRGLVSGAESLCASGLGACGGSQSEQTLIHCSGCPLVPMRQSKAREYGPRPIPQASSVARLFNPLSEVGSVSTSS